MTPSARPLAGLLLVPLALAAWHFGSSHPAAARGSVVSSAPRPADPAAAPPPVSSPDAPLASSTKAPVPYLDAESLLRELEPLAVTDEPRALALALAGDARLPADGVMAEARRALIVTLLVDTGQMADARARVRAFSAQYPASRYLPLVRGVTGLHPRPRPSELRDARPVAAEPSR